MFSTNSPSSYSAFLFMYVLLQPFSFDTAMWFFKKEKSCCITKTDSNSQTTIKLQDTETPESKGREKKVQYAIRKAQTNLLWRSCECYNRKNTFGEIQNCLTEEMFYLLQQKIKRWGEKKTSQVWLPLVPFYRMKCPLEDSITLKLYCVL